MLRPEAIENTDTLENVSLKPYTTFKIGGPSRYFVPIENLDALKQALTLAHSAGLPVFVLGGGSNILVNDKGLDAVVLYPVHRGVKVLQEDSEKVLVRAEAAEPWDELVKWAAEHGCWGIENLSHIPGKAGAALVQNIGAYGQQISDVVESAQVVDFSTGEFGELPKEDMKLAYRRSIFNTTHKGRYLILNLTLRLKKNAEPNLTYPDVQSWFAKTPNLQPSIHDIRRAIISIRDKKFPFPREERGGNAGSFFKNLVLSRDEYVRLELQFERNFGASELARLRDLRFSSGNGIKIPTAFLMEISGLKGCRVGGAQVNENQPLVLINRGGATARDVMLLARQVRQTIFRRTGLLIAIEPELVGFSQRELEEYLAVEPAAG
jgi:UDP-N-acetylmuramate dehydrogenase